MYSLSENRQSIQVKKISLSSNVEENDEPSNQQTPISDQINHSDFKPTSVLTPVDKLPKKGPQIKSSLIDNYIQPHQSQMSNGKVRGPFEERPSPNIARSLRNSFLNDRFSRGAVPRSPVPPPMVKTGKPVCQLNDSKIIQELKLTENTSDGSFNRSKNRALPGLSSQRAPEIG